MTRPFLADRIAGNGQRLAADETNQDPGETNQGPYETNQDLDPAYSSGRQELARCLPRCHFIAAQ